MPQVLIKKMSYTYLFEELSNFKKEELQLKVKSNTKYKNILRIFTPVPVPLLWPLSIFHADVCYTKDYETPFINFLQYNAWNYPNEIDIPYHSCGDKILKYKVEGKTIKFFNHTFSTNFVLQS